MRKLKNLLVTGGAGFIGSNFVRYLFSKDDFAGRVVNIDNLTYAGNIENLFDIEQEYGSSRYFFEQGDICDYKKLEELFAKYDIDTIVHFAAESHVDRSIYGPKDFIVTNIVGTFTLLEAARKEWQGRDDVLFHHISTDEVFGSLGDDGFFFENTPYDPRSPYSASKASSDHIVRAYFHTYDFPITLSNCSNNYGPYQYPEKFIALMITNILDNKKLPIYGDGKNVRDWLHVDDHCEAIWSILKEGKAGQTYNVGGNNEWKNIDIVNLICEKMASKLGYEPDYYKKQIEFVSDRLGHDRRYAINCDKIKNELGWNQKFDFDKGLDQTISWYLENSDWLKQIKDKKDYKSWIKKNY